MDYEEVYKIAYRIGYMEGVAATKKKEALLVKNLRTFLEAAKEVMDRGELPYDAMGDYSKESESQSERMTRIVQELSNWDEESATTTEVDYCNNCPYLPWGKDCISREQAIEAMAPFDTNHELRDTLDNLPPVTPTERAGEWIEIPQSDFWKCSCCGDIDFPRDFCPNCGAKMKGGTEND